MTGVLTTSGSPTFNGDSSCTIDSTGNDTVRAPASLLDETQGWWAVRFESGFAATADPYAGASVVEAWWGDNGSNFVAVDYAVSSDKFRLRRQAAGAGASAESAAQTFGAGDDLTVVGRWTATAVAISVNGGAFVAVANSGVPTLATADWAIGHRDDSVGQWIGSPVHWVACGTGTLTDADAAALHAFGNTDPTPEDLLRLIPACAVTAVMPMWTAQYLDETFTIIDPAADGSSRGVLPRLRVDVDFDTDPTATPRTWTDVTDDVRTLSYTRGGRNHELQRTEAGTLQATLDNRAGDYDPTNTGGAYYPGVKRMRWIRVRARWAAVDYPRWAGVIETIRQDWPDAGQDAVVTVTAVDAFKVLNLYDLAGESYLSELTSARVSNVLTDAMVAAGTVSTGLTTLVASGTLAEGSSALAHLLQVEESENGLLFANAEGAIDFHDRHYRLRESATSQGTIGDQAGEIPYRTGGFDLDDADVWNVIAVTPSGGAAAVARDENSVDAHYARRLNRATLFASPGEALSAAEYLRNLYSDPSPRVSQVTLLGAADTDHWDTILAGGNSDRFVWKRRASAHTIDQDVYVERVSDVVVPGTGWDVTFQLSPAQDQVGWVLGDPTFGLLGESTALVY